MVASGVSKLMHEAQDFVAFIQNIHDVPRFPRASLEIFERLLNDMTMQRELFCHS